ncbi:MULTISPECIES: carcinine hydrolase/isopenicillin-N N-acyltransferase family protein [Streptomyces]|uniref:carcinine hydrolase/isopenicillin-N N-acyltransferase family protein n=1 Tax=Streptomyces TaxID=1883 RepID=UPI001674C2E2|nr:MULTISPECIES: carcinine hydrolase/isopenicillin-N N-acyltransferase family protein [Streptomyces]MBK3527272.1 hypothetical protein [Streptomyces sp. MBT70]
MREAGWGLLDGMNDAGLAVSLTFGGRYVHGRGFALPLVLRHLLETCRTVDEALGRLRTIPIAIPQNVTLVDPDRTAAGSTPSTPSPRVPSPSPWGSRTRGATTADGAPAGAVTVAPP